jgi:hypothetical protein
LDDFLFVIRTLFKQFTHKIHRADWFGRIEVLSKHHADDRGMIEAAMAEENSRMFFLNR